MNGGERFDVFLSYHWQDHARVEALAQGLRREGLRVLLDRWYLTPGRPWPQELEEILGQCGAVAVCVEGDGPWQQREAYQALACQAKDPGFPVIPVLLPEAEPPLGFLGQNTWAGRPGRDDPTLPALLAAAIRGKPPGPELQARVSQTLATLCPYRGLLFFRGGRCARFSAAGRKLLDSLVRRWPGRASSRWWAPRGAANPPWCGPGCCRPCGRVGRRPGNGHRRARRPPPARPGRGSPAAVGSRP